MRRLSLDGLSRRFGAVQALDAVSFGVEAGTVHALMGENGAGKSTLIRILSGLDRPGAGTVAVDGAPLPPGDPAAVQSAGIRVLHQELHVVPALSVAENMHLALPVPRRLGLVDWRRLNAAAAAALERLGLSRIAPAAPMGDLGPGDQMLVRIAATLIRPEGAAAPWLYVLDEPTAALTGAEAERLFAVLDELTGAGAGVLYVSHRMDEVMRLASRVTVLRDGAHVSTRPMADTSDARIIEEMTGRALSDLFPPRAGAAPGPVALSCAGLSAGPLRDAALEVRAGEILGLAGLAGSGRGALLRALMGALPRQAGTVRVGGRALGPGTAAAWAAGLAYVPRERRSEGLMMRRPVAENVALPHLTALARGRVFLDHARQRRLAESQGRDVALKAASVAQAVGDLSGGNQQKTLFARALAGAPRVLLLDEPTRGVDVGAKFDLYRLIRRLAGGGTAVILASSDLPEVLGLADRICVLRAGRLAQTVENDGLSEADLLTLCYGRDAA
ncbi:sugar ABC transporter ATP-binding protein [Rhodobacteraceae bacterium CCMM004]|nr:sugar ABC transporter ATP-binding protein [Rhodobacteraceae bacterium CCMM004]